jgi:biopolymer transport protein TolR
MSFGQFPSQSGKTPFNDINVTPLVDVMLVLVVILIVTAPLMASRLKMDLPKVETAKAIPAFEPLKIAIQSSGAIYLNDQAIDSITLEKKFNEAFIKNAQTEVQIAADQAVPYGKVAELLALAQKTKLTRIGFVTHPVATPSKP